jgi:hypothetical protein
MSTNNTSASAPSGPSAPGVDSTPVAAAPPAEEGEHDIVYPNVTVSV